MKIEVEISEEEIANCVKELVTQRIADQLYKEVAGRGDVSLSYRYHTEVRDIIRTVMKENYDKLAKEAVSAAAKSIENRAVKQKLMQMLEES